MNPHPASVVFYRELFSDATQAGVFRLPQEDCTPLLEGAAAADCLVITVNLAGAHNKTDMLGAIAQALRFPEWFGANWDALNDCLCDMGWLPAPGYVVLLQHCDGTHARAENNFMTLIQIFQEATDDWRERGTPFWCLVDTLANGFASLPTRVEPE